MKGWGVSVIVGLTDMQDVATRPLQLTSGRTWTGCLFGGETNVTITVVLVGWTSIQHFHMSEMGSDGQLTTNCLWSKLACFSNLGFKYA